MTLPNFLIIGAWKSGTTSLHYYLAQHPDIYMSPGKQSYFFAFEGEAPVCSGPGDEEHHNQRLVTRIEDYRNLFKGVTTEKAIGEACSVYLYHPQAHRRIKHHIPGVKLLVMLRNPVETAYSAFMQQSRDGLETTKDFGDALRLEGARIRDNWRPMWHYKQRGYYHEQLNRYYDIFDASNIRTYLYDDFAMDQAAIVKDIFSFLGVDDNFVPDMTARYNASGLPRNRNIQDFFGRKHKLKKRLKLFLPKMVTRRLKPASNRIRTMNLQKPPLPCEIKQQLTDQYREDILKLQELIGFDLSGWLNGRPCESQ